jgi:rhomboid protease GluP
VNELPFSARLEAISSRVLITPVLVGLIVLAFGVTLLLGGGLLDIDGRVHVVLGSNYGALTLQGQWWRLITCQFLHFGIIHIAFNAMALWNIGPLAERLFGRWHFLLLYLVSGIGGGFGTLLWRPEANSAGASGAIFGVIGGLLAFLSRRDLGVPTLLVMHLRRSFLGFAAFSLLAGVLIPGVDNAAHVGGLLTGFALGFALARPVEIATRSRIDFVRPVAVLVAAAVSFVALARWLAPG